MFLFKLFGVKMLLFRSHAVVNFPKIAIQPSFLGKPTTSGYLINKLQQSLQSGNPNINTVNRQLRCHLRRFP